LCLLFMSLATTKLYSLSLHDALPISGAHPSSGRARGGQAGARALRVGLHRQPAPERHARSARAPRARAGAVLREGSVPGLLDRRSEEHTSELQSRFDLVCRLLLEKKN